MQPNFDHNRVRIRPQSNQTAVGVAEFLPDYGRNPIATICTERPTVLGRTGWVLERRNTIHSHLLCIFVDQIVDRVRSRCVMDDGYEVAHGRTADLRKRSNFIYIERERSYVAYPSRACMCATFTVASKFRRNSSPSAAVDTIVQPLNPMATGAVQSRLDSDRNPNGIERNHNRQRCGHWRREFHLSAPSAAPDAQRR